jgi:hypothetical protein
MTDDIHALAATLKGAVEAAQAALASYEAQTTDSAPRANGLGVVLTDRHGEELPPRDATTLKPSPGTARERARADYERRHPRRAAS